MQRPDPDAVGEYSTAAATQRARRQRQEGAVFAGAKSGERRDYRLRRASAAARMPCRRRRGMAAMPIF